MPAQTRVHHRVCVRALAPAQRSPMRQGRHFQIDSRRRHRREDMGDFTRGCSLRRPQRRLHYRLLQGFEHPPPHSVHPQLPLHLGLRRLLHSLHVFNVTPSAPQREVYLVHESRQRGAYQVSSDGRLSEIQRRRNKIRRTLL